MSDEFKTAEVAGKKVQWDPAQMRKIQEHPCFSEKACHAFGRCHIPVAPKCNIQCNYCIRDFDCVNESRPGVTTRILNPDEAMDMVKKVVDKYDYIKVIGIAGPGDPLANEETFETLHRLHEHTRGSSSASAPTACSCRTRSTCSRSMMSVISRSRSTRSTRRSGRRSTSSWIIRERGTRASKRQSCSSPSS